MTCPFCERDMWKDPTRDAQYCNNEECKFKYVVTGLWVWSVGQTKVRQRLLDGGHHLQTIKEFYGEIDGYAPEPVREVILETRDGWRKQVKLEPDYTVPIVQWVFMDPRDSEVKDFSAIAPPLTYHVRTFEWGGDFEQVQQPDGTIAGIEVWRER